MSITKYVVRTPFGNDGESFHRAMTRIKREALEQLEIVVRWKKGRDKKTGRYHFWVVEDEKDAMMFLLAFGDQMFKKGDTNERNEATKENMVEKQGERNDHTNDNDRR